ncbi:MAG: RsmB/NOP family class I SAM-dependent RNA methyltransferase [Treponema sp.]|nr:RsmB/NOP family class I SAM-dependent RNA methyltransferase [Treponema sp.]
MAKTKDKAARGGQGFEGYYSEIFGRRWPALKEALLKEGEPLAFTPFEGGSSYYLDAASVLAAISLPLKGAQNVLDMCAAPGGKSLVLASRMGADANLRCNERSFDRFQRLRKVVADHLPQEIQERIKISCGDGALLCKKENLLYDAILLDAPCSSERHVLNDPKYLADWSPARVKSLAMQQWALLSSAYRLLKDGGYLLYSTCALNQSENSQEAARLLKKFPEARAVSLEDVLAFQETGKKEISAFFDVAALPKFEAQELGFSILPDEQCGAGPIYFCLFKKGMDKIS